MALVECPAEGALLRHAWASSHVLWRHVGSGTQVRHVALIG